LHIKPKKFQEESFSVPSEFDDLSADVLERVRLDQARFVRVFATSAPERLWEGPFISPAQADISSSFGYRRIINGTPRTPHTGVDLRVPKGTEVLASNRGRIALVGDFFFSGNSLVIDHGGGLYTMYFHLSEFKVVEGDEVQKGEVIGLSGMTGRVSGPHLHWGARLNGARVDPFELVNKLAPGRTGIFIP
jgi:murein DD-endopeptidase MepM/ murein hydrolase activator NlpD